ncbi:Lrp/AsnC family transcriptional regulator [Microvirga arsenatis]|uniref:Winged helix-turn-helix transcriptional regulator n=1 Tax=Microvirga arsenatis TaxID=2692265 RepID=A0ABW9YYA8_9HYPH|nr:Lrp/AsnC family transcriptional regulator [Microvirga arsenatis]NBJ11115.1 winged helix-turn-helix transcriptional regulator [Microvirga arsenatis]NBJ25388.1 winged helix-turn-helix transcriptional regulator [Microvirga arsenatis]
MLDRLDEDLLLLLADNARRPAADMARKLRISRATVQSRIERLVDLGIIRRFTVELGTGEAERLIEAFVLVRLTAKDSAPTINAIRRMEAVTSIHTLSGRFDLIVDIRVRTMSELDTVLLAIRKLPDVVETESSVRMTRRK